MSGKSEEREQLEKRAKINSQWVYQGKVISLRKDLIQIDQEPPHAWEILVHPGAVAVIPINEKGNLLLVKQWRRAANQIILELPAGTLEKNEEPLECAQREIQEEIGYKADIFISLGGFYSSPGFCTEYLYLFIAEDLTESVLLQDEHEAIDVVEISLSEALSLIDSHQMNDSKTITGILQYDRWLNR